MADRNKVRLGIVASEGGMSCAYSVGVVLALARNYQIRHPHVVIGNSGSSNTLAYYVAGQYDSIENIWTNLLSTNHFISFIRIGKILDIDYLIDEVFKKQDPLDTAAILHSDIKFYIPATDKVEGTARYFLNDGSVDIFEALRASSAAQGLYGKSVFVGGREYIDGAPSAPFRRNIEKARQEGANKIIAIRNSNEDFISRSFMKMCALFQNKNLRRTIFEYCKSDALKPTSDTFVMRPSRKLPVKTLDNKRKHILAAIKLGYADALEAPIASFIGKSRS